MGRQAKIRRERRGGGSWKAAARAVAARCIRVDVAVRTPAFIAELKARTEARAGSPFELVDHEGLRDLALEILKELNVDTRGVAITSALRMGRLQIFVRPGPTAVVEEPTARAAARAKGSGTESERIGT